MTDPSSISIHPTDRFPVTISRRKVEINGTVLLTVFVTVATAIGGGAILLSTDGNFTASVAFLAAVIVLIASIYRLDWGFYIFMGMVLVFDQFPIPGFMPWTTTVYYFKNMKESPFFPNLNAAVLNPLELQLIMLFLIWFFVIAANRNRLVNKIQIWPAALLFFMVMIYSLVSGLRTGGDFLPALWEVRALFYLGILYIFVPQIIQTKEQVHTLFWIFIFAISFKAVQGAYRFTMLGFTTGGYETLTNHEDPVFILNLIVFLFALVFLEARTKQIPALIFLLIPLMLGFFAGERRSAYAAIVPTFAGLVVILPRLVQRRFLKSVAYLVLFIAIYFAIFWNSSGKLASPVKLVKSGFNNDKETAGERYYSNLYREIEKYDLAKNIQKVPVTGLGFGHKYEMPLPLVHIDFTLRDYIPHNELLWLLVKTGGIGFGLFCLFLDSFAFRGAQIVTRLNDPYLKAVGALAIAAVINQFVVSNFDLQLTYYRNMVFLGTLMGLISALSRMDSRVSELKPAK